MRRRSPARRTLHAAVALLALLGVLAASAAGLAPHTDDGCRTETHCLVCRSSHGHAAAVVIAPHSLHAEQVVEPARHDAPPRLPQVEARACASRGPPADSPASV